MRRTVEVIGFGKITAEERVLDMISLWGRIASDKFKDEGETALAEQAQDIGDIIYNLLDTKDYYTKITG